MREQLPLVSVVIPVYNSEATLDKCLTSIESQTYRNIEIIVVDGKSNDESLAIAAKHNCRAVTSPERGMTRQSNLGLSAANGKYVYRHDSDVIIDDHLIEEAIAKCEGSGYEAAAIFWSPDSTLSFWAAVRKLEKECYRDDLRYIGARLVRRDLLVRAGGWNERITAGEDYDLYNRLVEQGCRVARIKTSGLHLGEPRNLNEIARKQFQYGKTLHEFFLANGKNGVLQMSPLRKPLLENWRRFARHPALALGFLLYEFVIYSSTIIGYSSSIVDRRIRQIWKM